MRSTKQLSITLPLEMAAKLRARVESGEYASESEAIREGLRALEAQHQAVERWLGNEVVAAYDAHAANPAGVRAIDDVREMLDKVEFDSGQHNKAA